MMNIGPIALGSILFGALLTVTLGCSKSAPPPGKLVTVENVCSEKDGSAVRLIGYFRYPRSLVGLCSRYGDSKTCDMSLYAAADTPQNFDAMRDKAEVKNLPNVDLRVPVGEDPGEMGDLPKSYSEKDVVLHLPGSAKAGEGQKVTLDGKVRVYVNEAPDPSRPGGAPTKTCSVDVLWAAP